GGCCATARGDTRPVRKSAVKAIDITPNGRIRFPQIICGLLAYRFLKRKLSLVCIAASRIQLPVFFRRGPVEIPMIGDSRLMPRAGNSMVPRQVVVDGFRRGVEVEWSSEEPRYHEQWIPAYSRSDVTYRERVLLSVAL